LSRLLLSRATIGHAADAPPSSDMNSRRFTRDVQAPDERAAEAAAVTQFSLSDGDPIDIHPDRELNSKI
jgi:hypothetical protein